LHPFSKGEKDRKKTEFKTKRKKEREMSERRDEREGEKKDLKFLRQVSTSAIVPA
jgi:hypothetical protein